MHGEFTGVALLEMLLLSPKLWCDQSWTYSSDWILGWTSLRTGAAARVYSSSLNVSSKALGCERGFFSVLATLWLGTKKQRFGQRVKCLPCKLSDLSSVSRTCVKVKGRTDPRKLSFDLVSVCLSAHTRPSISLKCVFLSCVPSVFLPHSERLVEPMCSDSS